ncbi:MAG: AAA family ATPase [Deltaproteobacteria bacterium]|jgi:hypothetical protein|nr:AAA family ATPase [Deltaproteobacteria bacterium]
MEMNLIPETESKDKDLGLGIFSFDDMIKNNHVYVDKTGVIYDLLKPNDGIYFLARPRRFGKSLLLNTIKCLFEGKRDLFKGLAIENKTPKYGWDICRVVYIDMSRLDMEPEQLNDSLTKRLNKIAKAYGVTLSEKKCGPAFSELIETLYDLPHATLPYSTDNILTDNYSINFNQKPVVLIDEYDCPLITYLSESTELQNNRKILKNFYLNFKSCSPMIRFGFITGITLFQELSVFSSMNSFQNITLDPDFSTICGFSEAEIKTYYENNINKSFLTMKENRLLSANWTKDDFIHAIIEWYDGYNWDGKSMLINPQSIKEFFKFNIFNNYWYDTAQPQFLDQLKFFNIKKKDFLNVFDENMDIAHNSNSPVLSVINPQSVLFQCGYLTLDRREGTDGSIQKIHLKVPNKEVKISFAREYLIPHFFPNLTEVERDGLFYQYENFSKFFIRRDSKNAAGALSSIFENFSHQTQQTGEHFFQSQIKTALSFVGHLQEERSVGHGDIDLFLERFGAKTIYVIEIKYRKSPILSERVVNSEITDQHVLAASSIDASARAAEPEQPGDGIRIKFDAKEIREKRTPDEQLKVKHALELAARDAFDQIRNRKYPRASLYQDKTVYSVAIAVIGRSDVEIEYREVNPSDYEL